MTQLLASIDGPIIVIVNYCVVIDSIIYDWPDPDPVTRQTQYWENPSVDWMIETQAHWQPIEGPDSIGERNLLDPVDPDQPDSGVIVI